MIRRLLVLCLFVVGCEAGADITDAPPARDAGADACSSVWSCCSPAPELAALCADAGDAFEGGGWADECSALPSGEGFEAAGCVRLAGLWCCP